MRGRRFRRNRRILTVLGSSIALGAMLVIVVLATPGSGVTTERSSFLSKPTYTACPVGSDPFLPGYDPVTHDMYVPNLLSGNISVIGGTCTSVGTITLPAGAQPMQAAFNPADNDIFVTDNALGQIYQISGLTVVNTITNAKVGYIPSPWGITWAPVLGSSEGALFVTNSNSFWTLVELEGPNFSVANDALQRYPFDSAQGVAFDPYNNCLWVVYPSNNSVIAWYPPNIAKGSKVIHVGTEPTEVAFDYADGYVYVTNTASDTVTVLNSTFGIVGSISGFSDPEGVAWDQSTLTIYVASSGNDKLYEIGGSSGLSIIKKVSLPSSSDPLFVAYDGASGRLYVTQGLGDAVYAVS
jgi:DNA-binding beta-propeller fold protein YncE